MSRQTIEDTERRIAELSPGIDRLKDTFSRVVVGQEDGCRNGAELVTAYKADKNSTELATRLWCACEFLTNERSL